MRPFSPPERFSISRIIAPNFSYCKCYFLLTPYADKTSILKSGHTAMGVADLDFRQIGLKIKERRRNQGLTQEYIANQLDVNPSHISNIEGGRAHPSLSALVKIANILECSVDYFISGEYTYKVDEDKALTLDDKIMSKLKYCDMDKKSRVLKMIDLL